MEWRGIAPQPIRTYNLSLPGSVLRRESFDPMRDGYGPSQIPIAGSADCTTATPAVCQLCDFRHFDLPWTFRTSSLARRHFLAPLRPFVHVCALPTLVSVLSASSPSALSDQLPPGPARIGAFADAAQAPTSPPPRPTADVEVVSECTGGAGK